MLSDLYLPYRISTTLWGFSSVPFYRYKNWVLKKGNKWPARLRHKASVLTHNWLITKTHAPNCYAFWIRPKKTSELASWPPVFPPSSASSTWLLDPVIKSTRFKKIKASQTSLFPPWLASLQPCSHTLIFHPFGQLSKSPQERMQPCQGS